MKKTYLLWLASLVFFLLGCRNDNFGPNDTKNNQQALKFRVIPKSEIPGIISALQAKTDNFKIPLKNNSSTRGKTETAFGDINTDYIVESTTGAGEIYYIFPVTSNTGNDASEIYNVEVKSASHDMASARVIVYQPAEDWILNGNNNYLKFSGNVSHYTLDGAPEDTVTYLNGASDCDPCPDCPTNPQGPGNGNGGGSGGNNGGGSGGGGGQGPGTGTPPTGTGGPVGYPGGSSGGTNGGGTNGGGNNGGGTNGGGNNGGGTNGSGNNGGGTNGGGNNGGGTNGGGNNGGGNNGGGNNGGGGGGGTSGNCDVCDADDDNGNCIHWIHIDCAPTLTVNRIQSPCGGGGVVIAPQKDPCTKTKGQLGTASVKEVIQNLKNHIASGAGGEKGYGIKKNGTAAPTNENSDHSVNFGDPSLLNGGYHNHTGTKVDIFSSTDIATLIEIARYNGSSNPTNAFMGLIAPNGIHYVIRFDGTQTNLPALGSFSETQIEIWKIDQITLWQQLLMKNSYYYIVNGKKILNSKGLERILFDTLEKMGLKDKIIVQQIDDNNNISTVIQNPDKSTTSVPCP